MDMVGDGVLELSESLMGHGQGPERAQKIKADLGLPIFCRHARPTIEATELATLTKLTNKSSDVCRHSGRIGLDFQQDQAGP
jgi:hypothetical protein